MTILSSYRLSAANNTRIAAEAEGLGFRFIPTTFDDSLEEIIARIDREISTATIFLGGRLSREQWENAGALRWIHVPWAGVNTLFEIEELRTADVAISNSSGVMADAVADQVMGYVVMLYRSLPEQIRQQVERRWERFTDVEDPRRRRLRGETLGIVGYGAIGRAVAERARAFGMRVVGLRRTTAEPEPLLDRLYGADGLDALLGESDVVLLTLPLTEQTRGSFGEKEIARMKPSAYLINVGRGDTLRQEEVIEALASGRIAGGAFDVFSPEPLPSDSLLWGLTSVIVTPHSAGGFVGFGDAVTDLFIDNLRRHVAGRALRNRVDPRYG